jgi:hypothetical protein
MILAHSGIIHALYGGFFGWLGVIGALMPDLMGLVGWYLYLTTGKRTGSWYDYMPPLARSAYWLMHSIPVAAALLVAEWLTRMFFCGLMPWGGTLVPVFALGYATHVLSDWVTHRQDIGDPLLLITGRTWGIDWFKSRYYWTEWTGLLLVVLIIQLGPSNVIIRHIVEAIPC